MNDAVGLLASAIGLILVPICVLRLVLGRADLRALYRAPGDAWPQGVQEEDGPRWRLDRVRRVAPATRASSPGPATPRSRHEVDLSPGSLSARARPTAPD